MKYIEQGWNGYLALLPKDAGEVQIRETRQAFYGGAAVLFETMLRMLDPGSEPTENDMRRMSDIQKELQEFGAQIDKRYLKPSEH